MYSSSEIFPEAWLPSLSVLLWAGVNIVVYIILIRVVWFSFVLIRFMAFTFDLYSWGEILVSTFVLYESSEMFSFADCSSIFDGPLDMTSWVTLHGCDCHCWSCSDLERLWWICWLVLIDLLIIVEPPVCVVLGCVSACVCAFSFVLHCTTYHAYHTLLRWLLDVVGLRLWGSPRGGWIVLSFWWVDVEIMWSTCLVDSLVVRIWCWWP